MSYWPEEWGPKPDWPRDDKRWNTWRPPWHPTLQAAGLRRRLEHMLEFCKRALAAMHDGEGTWGVRDTAAMVAAEGRDMKLHGLQVRNAADVATATKEMSDEQGVRTDDPDGERVEGQAGGGRQGEGD